MEYIQLEIPNLTRKGCRNRLSGVHEYELGLKPASGISQFGAMCTLWINAFPDSYSSESFNHNRLRAIYPYNETDREGELPICDNFEKASMAG